MATKNDPRTMITPDSFAVAPALIGLPLAGPWRRLFAFLSDLVPVGILANAGFLFFLAVSAAVLTWRALSRDRNRRVNVAIRSAAAFGALFVVFQVGDAVDSDGPQRGPDPPDADSINRAVEEALAQAGVNADAAADPGAAGDQEVLGLRDRLVAFVADDLGIGFGWGALYFTTFLVLGRGQTPGKRMLGVRVIRLDAKPISWWLAFERFGSYFASLSTGLLGFAQIFWDRNRQALHDKAVETVVVRVRRGDHDIARRLNQAQSA